MTKEITMRQLLSLFLLLLFVGTSFASENEIEQRTNLFLNDEAIKNSPVSIYVANSLTGETLLAVNPTLSITPASVLKLATSATALELMGSNYKFSTKVWYSGIISDSILYGDLIVEGGGDPTLGSPYFGFDNDDFLIQWAQLIKHAGIDSVNGNLIVDTGIYSDKDVPQTWIWEDLGNYFGAAAQGISLYDNTFRITFETDNLDGGNTHIINTSPEIPGLKIKNKVKASNDRRDRAYVYGSPFDSYRIIRGTLPKGRSQYSIRASIPDPGILLATRLKEKLADESIVISGQIEKQDKLNYDLFSEKQLLVKWDSPTLERIIEKLNHESINLYAESLCKHIGLTQKSEGSTSAGTEAIKVFWKDKGIDVQWFFQADGSGLSRSNAISAKTLTEILVFMKNYSANFNAFENSIPLTGLQGTQKYYFQQSFLKGEARAKSGSMTRVRSFAGYMETQNNTPIAFTIIVNNFNCGSFTMAKKMEKLIELLYLEL
jgi:D-alanyl-D-alanine carboxypeptidase/D-alanyl-D-alanine-endopeptidase (penicillin-binding protein 4)